MGVIQFTHVVPGLHTNSSTYMDIMVEAPASVTAVPAPVTSSASPVLYRSCPSTAVHIDVLPQLQASVTLNAPVTSGPLSNGRDADVKNPAVITGDVFEDIGGLERELASVKEVVQLPLLEPEIFTQFGLRYDGQLL